ncbi:MAG: hypothetical protein JO175_08025 [Candidatus Eremiobacteraeota bacterium]|nr:hypothetical protein [Candidatus Eremiobacteraeota bacterium]
MAHLEGTYEQVNQRLAAIDLRFDAIDRRFDAFDRRFDAFDRKIDEFRAEVYGKFDSFRSDLDEKIDRRFMWTIAVVLSTWLSTILAIFLHR